MNHSEELKKAREAMTRIASLCEERVIDVKKIHAICVAVLKRGKARAKCEFCNVEFETGYGTGRRSTARFCCDKHRTYWQRRKAREEAGKIVPLHVPEKKAAA